MNSCKTLKLVNPSNFSIYTSFVDFDLKGLMYLSYPRYMEIHNNIKFNQIESNPIKSDAMYLTKSLSQYKRDGCLKGTLSSWRR